MTGLHMIISDDDTGGIYFCHACRQRMFAVCLSSGRAGTPLLHAHAVFNATERERVEDAFAAVLLEP